MDVKAAAGNALGVLLRRNVGLTKKGKENQDADMEFK